MTSMPSMPSRREGRRSDRRDGAKGPVRCLPLPHLRGQTAEVPHGDHLRRGVQPVSPQGAQPPHEAPSLPTASPAPPTRRVRRQFFPLVTRARPWDESWEPGGAGVPTATVFYSPRGPPSST